MIFHLFAHNVPVEERSRAFGYLVAAGSVGQVVASIVSLIILFLTYSTYVKKNLYFIEYKHFPLFLDMSKSGMANWILFIWNDRYSMDFVVANAISRNQLAG